MVRIQLFSSVTRKFSSTFTFHSRIICSALSTFSVRFVKINTNYYLKRKLQGSHNLLPDQIPVRWRGHNVDLRSRYSPCFLIFSFQTCSTSAFWYKLSVDSFTPILKRQLISYDWRSSVASVLWYIRTLSLVRLECWVLRHCARSRAFSHQLRFRFTSSRLAILFTNPATRSDYFFVSSGLFTRYFFFKKSIKKSKVIKLIMARFARKMIILLGLRDISLRVRGLPTMLETLVSTLFSPMRHPFESPLTGGLVDEVDKIGTTLFVSSLSFVNIKPFGFMKVRLKGRIKRKVRRRLYRLNRPDY